MYRLEAIKQLLNSCEHPFAKLFVNDYNNLEVQVNVKPSEERIEGEFKGKRWNAYKYPDGEIAKPFRIPWKANTEPEYNDSKINHSLDKIEAIGCTGWDWRNKKSIWFGYDFDSMVGHTKGLTDEQLNEVLNNIKNLDYITVVSSKSGKGFHLYIKLMTPESTVTHTEHAALGRAILSSISAEIGFDLSGKVDICGGNLWIYHTGKTDKGFKLIKESKELFSNIPPNWRNHIDVIKGKSTRSLIETNLDDITGSLFVQLDKEHIKLLTWLKEKKKYWWWDFDRHMLVCHTHDLKLAKEALGFVGLFDTVATGKEQYDQNCFGFPTANGGWTIRRHSKGAQEHPIWININGWTTTTFNIPPDLNTVCRYKNGTIDDKGTYIFNNVKDAFEALKLLGIDIEPLDGETLVFCSVTRINRLRNRGLTIIIDCEHQPRNIPNGYYYERKKLKKLIDISLPEFETRFFNSVDNFVRHVVSMGKDAGWYIKTDQGWILENNTNVNDFLIAKGIKDTSLAMGQCIENPWELVTLPFQPEYPGNRKWNKETVQFSVIPEPGEYTTWTNVFNHLGANLDNAVKNNEWCKSNGITNGGEYLKCWAAAMIQYPNQPLPYLFFYSQEENTGKSTFHESLSLLFKNQKGYVDAVNALTNPQNFTGELLGAVLCYTEEFNLKLSKSASQRIKNFVTGRTINIHFKNKTPFDIENITHWVQCANDPEFCPIMPGDTRIVMITVSKPEVVIPKEELLNKLKSEVPYFLHYLLELEIPKSIDRLRIPIIETLEKKELQLSNINDLEIFIQDNCFEIPGAITSLNDFHKAFTEQLSPYRRAEWHISRLGRMFPKRFPRGRMPGTNHVGIGNLSLSRFDSTMKEITPSEPYIQLGDRIYKSNETMKG